jgi:4'-phosphopantetheinyl transferase EntD
MFNSATTLPDRVISLCVETQRHTLYDDGGEPVALHWLPIAATTVSDADFLRCGIDLPKGASRWVNQRRAEYFYGRRAARSALEGLGLGHHQVRIGAHREPCWPRGVVGSISHHVSIAAAVALPASRFRAAGIDIECVLDSTTAYGLCGHVFSLRELALLSRQAGERELNTWLTLVFSAKESFFKAAFPFVQRYFDFDAVELTGINPNEHTLDFTIRDSLCSDFASGDLCTIRYTKLGGETVCTSCILSST